MSVCKFTLRSTLLVFHSRGKSLHGSAVDSLSSSGDGTSGKVGDLPSWALPVCLSALACWHPMLPLLTLAYIHIPPAPCAVSREFCSWWSSIYSSSLQSVVAILYMCYLKRWAVGTYVHTANATSAQLTNEMWDIYLELFFKFIMEDPLEKLTGMWDIQLIRLEVRYIFHHYI